MNFATYLKIVNPKNKAISSKDRPTLRIGDMEGMDQGAKIIMTGALTIKRKGKEFYALKGKNVVGYIAPLSKDELDLAVVKEYQRHGIGRILLEQFRKYYPHYKSGGYTPAGLKVEESVFRKKVK